MKDPVVMLYNVVKDEVIGEYRFSEFLAGLIPINREFYHVYKSKSTDSG